MKKIKLNILSMALGATLILISLLIGYLNNFSQDQGLIFLLIGAPLLLVGIISTPKIWKYLAYISEIVVMLFSKSPK